MGAPLKISSSLNTTLAWVVGCSLFSSIFLAVGLAMGYFSFLQPISRSHVAKNWVNTPCQIVRSGVEGHQDSMGRIYYRLDIAYQYQAAGRRYQSTQYDFTNTHFGSRDWMTAAVRANPVGKQTVCYVDPQDATSAVLVRNFCRDEGRWFAPGFISLFGVLLLIPIAWLTVRKRKFGKSNFELKSAPVPMGGILEGKVTMERVIQPKGGYAVKLVCVHSVATRGRTTSIRETTLWENSRHVSPGIDGSIPVNFVLPERGVETSSISADDRILWRVEVTAKIPGIDYAAQFDVPVAGRAARH